MREKIARGECDLLVLNKSLQDGSGLQLLRALRERRETRHLAVVALLGPQESGQRLEYFQAGADECLSLNQDIQECVARMKAVLRRLHPQVREEILRAGDIELNLSHYVVRVKGREIRLTSKELDLLYVFMNAPQRVLSRPYLIERVWGYNYFGSPRTVDVHVRRLRQKLGKTAAAYIQTLSCVGYKLVPPDAGTKRK
ncbi:MAG: response regulator transcription factor [Elusimicrobia bacterium]|nr:response regulator transcription factor [Elusimicrobiota bacterium]